MSFSPVALVAGHVNRIHSPVDLALHPWAVTRPRGIDSAPLQSSSRGRGGRADLLPAGMLLPVPETAGEAALLTLDRADAAGSVLGMPSGATCLGEEPHPPTMDGEHTRGTETNRALYTEPPTTRIGQKGEDSDYRHSPLSTSFHQSQRRCAPERAFLSPSCPRMPAVRHTASPHIPRIPLGQ